MASLKAFLTNKTAATFQRMGLVSLLATVKAYA